MYTTKAHIESLMGTLSAGQDTYFTEVLDAAIDSYIDKVTETTFGSEGIVSVYASSFDGDFVTIPTMHDITVVSTVDGNSTPVVVDSSSYTFFPRFGDNKYAIRNINTTWNAGYDNLVISGKLGYKVVPADITAVATELAISVFSGRTDSLKSERVGDWAVTYADMEKVITPRSLEILQSYRRLSRRI